MIHSTWKWTLCVHAAAVSVCLLTSAGSFADEADAAATQTVQLRFEWGGGTPRLWSGLLELSAGRFERPVSLGVEADEPGTIWSDGSALWIQRRSERIYDGFDVSVTTPATATIDLTLQSVGPHPLRERRRFDLTELLAGATTVGLGDGQVKLIIRRRPGDSLKVAVDRPHLIYWPGEKFQATVSLNVAERDRLPEGSELEWELRPARHRTVLQHGRLPVAIPGDPAQLPQAGLDLDLPSDEGAYDLEFRYQQGISVETSSVQMLVLADRSPEESLAADAVEPRLVDSFEPARADADRKIARTATGANWNAAVARILELLPLGQKPDAQDAHKRPLEWEAYRLKVGRTGAAHRLVVTAPAGVSQNLGVSVIQSNAAGQFMPIGLDTGVEVTADEETTAASQSAGGSPAVVKHEVVFWPNVREPVLLVHNMDSGGPLAVATVDVYELDRAERRDGPSSDAVSEDSSKHWEGERAPPHGWSAEPEDHTTSREGEAPAEPEFSRDRRLSRSFALPISNSHGVARRLVGPYLAKPLLPENFNASEAYDASSGRSLDDWVTFHQAAVRMAGYLRQGGYNSLLIGVLADGSTIYPSRLLQPTPRYDTGVFFSTGQDPLRKDALELLYRVFDREGLALIPELQFKTPLPELEAILARQGDESRGLELVGRDGKTWRTARGSIRGVAPYYNPLDPRVQQAIVDVLAELVDRYKSHPAFAGVALELSSDGYLQFPGLEWGYDDETVARFEQASGIDVPDSDDGDRYQQRYEFLTRKALRQWIRWRCEELSRFHRRLIEVVAEAHPSARLVFSARRTSGDRFGEGMLGESLTAGARPQELLAHKGIDFSLITDAGRLVILRPGSWTPCQSPLGRAFDESLNSDANLAAAFSGRQNGCLFFRQPRECRIAGFDEVCPWQPAFTWLAVQATPAGAAHRKLYARALAASDAQAVFDGSWMIPFGQEHSTRRMRESFARLPAVPFHDLETDSQPVKVRLARGGEKSYLYFVNEFSAPTRIRLVLSGGESLQCRSLDRGRSVPLERGPDGSRYLTAKLEAFDLWACELNDAGVRVERVDVLPARQELERLAGHIQAFEHSLAQWHRSGVPQRTALRNSGFELAGGDRQLPGWDVAGHDAVEWALDRANPHSGNSALMLASAEESAALRSAPLPLEDSRLVTISAWLRSNRDGADVRLAFEAQAEDRDFLQQADVQVDRHWRRYEFQVQDLPAGPLKEPRVRVEMSGPGRVWIDDVDVSLHRITPDELRQLTKVYSALSLAWENKRYADCQRFLDGYWGRLLSTNTPDTESDAATNSRRELRLPRLFGK